MSATARIAVQFSGRRGEAARRAWIGTGVLFLMLTASGWTGGGDVAGVKLDSAAVQFRLDLNVATKEELMLLPGVGDALSDAIIEYRRACAPDAAFRCAADLDAVYRIGPVTVAKLAPFLIFPRSAGDAMSAEGVLP